MKKISFHGKIGGEITIPGSKYIANRLLAIASLARGITTIRNLPYNNDIKHAIQAFQDLGVDITASRDFLQIRGSTGKFPKDSVKIININTGESGTLMRFITAVAALVNNDVRITGSDRIKERPVGELVDSLESLGAEVIRENGEYPPIIIKSGYLKGGPVKVNGEKSSQFISALLLIAPYAKENVEIQITGEAVSRSYINLTNELIAKFGVKINQRGNNKYFIESGQSYRGRDFSIPADWSTANFFFAAAAITGGKITINNLDLNSSQGEAGFIEVLENMGCKVLKRKSSVTLEGPQSLSGIDVDMSSIPDAVPALSAVAAFCKDDVIIRNIAHLRYKECDRIKAIKEELSKIGVDVQTKEDEILINGSNIQNKPVTFNPRNDHRIAMSMALIGLRIPGIRIDNPECADKSYPGYWEKLQELGVTVNDV